MMLILRKLVFVKVYIGGKRNFRRLIGYMMGTIIFIVMNLI